MFLSDVSSFECCNSVGLVNLLLRISWEVEIRIQYWSKSKSEAFLRRLNHASCKQPAAMCLKSDSNGLVACIRMRLWNGHITTPGNGN